MTPRREIQVNPAYLATGGRKQAARSKGKRVAKRGGTAAMRNQLLKRIQDHKQRSSEQKSSQSGVDNAGGPQSELEESLRYLENLTKEGGRKTRKKGQTEKERQTRSAPAFGCLKNGDLPTFRVWSQSAPVSDRAAALARMRLGRRGVEEQQAATKLTSAAVPGARGADDSPTKPSGAPPTSSSPPSSANQPSPIPSHLSQGKNSVHAQNTYSSSIKAHTPASTGSIPKIKPTTGKRAKTRRVRLGKNTGTRKVAILTTSRSIRDMVQADQAAANRASIHAVCTFLRRKGLLKHGSKAPDSVLRAMHGNALLAGEIQNEGKGATLHNYQAETEAGQGA